MAVHAKRIYVEILIRGSLDELWKRTQTPDLHELWDLRFSKIMYLPRISQAELQKFNYMTRIGFGLQICGEGESVGSFESERQRSSALRFWSDDPKSLIREGSGYWKYISPDENGTANRFLTLYDYDVRFGWLGRQVDRWIFRPLIGWATAWSFDRLRLWIEDGISPATSARCGVVYLIARLALASGWLYQGVVPKLLLRHPEELAMIRSAGLSQSGTVTACLMIGVVEVVIGLLLVLAWQSRVLLWFTLAAMPLALLSVAIATPQVLGAPFNPVTLNLSFFSLALIALLLGPYAPSAGRCLRRPPEGKT